MILDPTAPHRLPALRRSYDDARVARRERVDAVTPDQWIMAKEEGRDRPEILDEDPSDTEPEEWDLRAEVLGESLQYIFSEGPSPLPVMQRTFAFCGSQRPDLLDDVDPHDLEMIFSPDPQGERWRIRAIVTKKAGEEIDIPFAKQRIDYVLRRNYQRELSRGREPIFAPVALSEILYAHDGDAGDYTHAGALEAVMRRDACAKVLEFFFASGSTPLRVVQRVYAVCRSERAGLLLNMSLHDEGRMLGNGRAAGSWRAKAVITRALKGAGMQGFKLPWQKSEEACGKYREAALGNSNRRGGKKTKPQN